MEILFNGKLSIEVSAHGAELCSIFSNGKEYLWQADPAFWKRHSPVLFPIVGSVWENEYRNEGTTYALTQHGFARDMEFTLILEHDDEVRYQLVSNEETLKKDPFPCGAHSLFDLAAHDADRILRHRLCRGVFVG